MVTHLKEKLQQHFNNHQSLIKIDCDTIIPTFFNSIQLIITFSMLHDTSTVLEKARGHFMHPIKSLAEQKTNKN